MKVRVVLLGAVLLAGAIFIGAEESLPPGLMRSGNVIMMQPIADGEGESGPSNAEHRPGTIRILSASDRDLYTRAFDASDRGDWTGALNLAGAGHDPNARRLLEWRRLLDKNSGATFADIDAFLKANPDWPLRDTLFARAEAAIGPDMTPQAVVSWFGSRTPASSAGKIALGESLIAVGRASEGRPLLHAGWRDGSFDPPQELAIVQKAGRDLTSEDDKARLDNLLWRDLTGDAKRELARVDERTAQIGEARIALREDPKRAKRLIEGLPATAGSDPGLLFDRARAERRAGDNRDAEMLLLRIASREAARAHPTTWWGEFNIEARQALQDHDYRTAYTLATEADLPPGDENTESQFLAGWIALRFLHEPSTGIAHFQRLNETVARPISKARAHYWIGRCYEALGNTADASREYQTAADLPATFYGQLALARIGNTTALHVPDASVTPEPRDRFESDALVQPMEVLADLGEVNLLRTFALRDVELHPEPAHAKMLAQQLTEWGFREAALRIAKLKGYDGVIMLDYTHPVIPIPAYHGPGSAPEPAVVLGLIRQETEFDPSSVSGPGARGIMQLMPEAAALAARDSSLPYRPNDLLSDPDYNMQLGMAELEGDIDFFGGSYILAAAAYNAGRHNVEKWLAASGDPRSSSEDPIDWIEAIPFSETRNYVERVIENTQIYRNRLAGHDEPLRILGDLYRPNPPTGGRMLAASSASPPAAGEAKEAPASDAGSGAGAPAKVRP